MAVADGVAVTGKISRISWFGVAYVTLDQNAGNVPSAHCDVEFLKAPEKGFLSMIFGRPKVGDAVAGVLEAEHAQTELDTGDDRGWDNRCPRLFDPRMA